MIRYLAAGGLLVLSGALVGPGGAEETEIWSYQCFGDDVVGSRICTTELATFEDGREFVVYFVHGGKPPTPLVVAGEDDTLKAVTIKVDKKDPVSAESCDGGACFFGPEDSALLLKQFRKGQKVAVTIRAGGDEIVFDRSLSLRGFSAAFSAAGS